MAAGLFRGALVSKADAILALRMILSQLQVQIDERVLDFKADQIVQSLFCQALEELSDSHLGWRQLCQIYERELAAAPGWKLKRRPLPLRDRCRRARP